MFQNSLPFVALGCNHWVLSGLDIITEKIHRPIADVFGVDVSLVSCCKSPNKNVGILSKAFWTRSNPSMPHDKGYHTILLSKRSTSHVNYQDCLRIIHWIHQSNLRNVGSEGDQWYRVLGKSVRNRYGGTRVLCRGPVERKKWDHGRTQILIHCSFPTNEYHAWIAWSMTCTMTEQKIDHLGRVG